MYKYINTPQACLLGTKNIPQYLRHGRPHLFAMNSLTRYRQAYSTQAPNNNTSNTARLVRLQIAVYLALFCILPLKHQHFLGSLNNIILAGFFTEEGPKHCKAGGIR